MAKAPTKLGELLGCGIPCLANESLADMGPVLERNRVGVVVRKIGNEELREALGQLIKLARDPDISVRCRQVAEEYFSLASGVEKYNRIYRELGGQVAC
jgi:glycosyltransferase involved in cell wall biosynthesis